MGVTQVVNPKSAGGRTASAGRAARSAAQPILEPDQLAAADAEVAANEAAEKLNQRRKQATRMTVLGLAVVLIGHVWIISAGWMTTPWPTYSGYYSRQADAFAKGQVSLLNRPPEKLLNLPDPYDPVANRWFRQIAGRHDTVLYDGQLYLYWGPVPAILLTPIKLIAPHAYIGDEWLVFAFTAGTMLFLGLIVRRLWERFFSDRPAWTLFVGIVVAGLATPLAYLLARSAVYEAAIMGGQCFLLAGIWLLLPRSKKPVTTEPAGVKVSRDDPLVGAFMGGSVFRLRHLNPQDAARAAQTSRHAGKPWASKRPGSDDPSDPVPGPLRLSLAGLMFSLAVGSRVSLAIGVFAVGVAVCIWLALRGRQIGLKWTTTRLLAFGMPLLVTAILLASYNHARFGKWTEFGQKYQLTGNNYKATPALFSIQNFPPSLYSYTLRPVYLLAGFPFVEARKGDGTFPAFVKIPPHYEYNEPIAGVVIVAPYLWLALIPLAWAAMHIRPVLKKSPADNDARPLSRVILLIVLAAGIGFAPVLFMVGSTMRYLADFAPGFMVLALVGIWIRQRSLAENRRGTVVFNSAVLLMAGWSVLFGLLLSINGYYQHFRSFNPELAARLGYQSIPQVLGHADEPGIAPRPLNEIKNAHAD